MRPCAPDSSALLPSAWSWVGIWCGSTDCRTSTPTGSSICCGRTSMPCSPGSPCRSDRSPESPCGSAVDEPGRPPSLVDKLCDAVQLAAERFGGDGRDPDQQVASARLDVAVQLGGNLIRGAGH